MKSTVIYASLVLTGTIMFCVGIWVGTTLTDQYTEVERERAIDRQWAPVISISAADHNSSTFTIQDGIDALARAHNGTDGWLLLTCGRPLSSRCVFWLDEPIEYPIGLKRNVIGLSGGVEEFRWRATGEPAGFDWAKVVK